MMSLSKQNLTCDLKIEPQAPVSMTNTNGFTICGQRGGQPYKNVTRVDPISKMCPDGTVACSDITSAENTICYPPELIETSCPITDIFITKNIKEATSMAKSEQWIPYPKKIAYTWFLVYSKVQDFLPITTTSIEYKPCVNPEQLSQQPDQKFYPLEIDKALDCTADEELGELYDDRWQTLANF